MSDEPDAYTVLFPDKGTTRPPVVTPITAARAAPYARKALQSELDALARAGEGTRNDQLNVSAFNISQIVAAGHLDHGQAWAELHGCALAVGLSEAETLKTLASGFEAGARSPRVVADLDNDEPPAVTILHLPEDDGVPAVEKLFPRIDWHELWKAEDDEEWIVYPLIPARRLVALFSPPKVGKSLLMLELAVQISRGLPVLGDLKVKKHRVLYVDFENDPRGDIRSRLRAMGVAPEDLEDLVYLSFPQLAYLDTPMGGLQLVEVAKHYGCTVVVIDTISRAVGGEENDNDTWLGFYRNTGLHLKAAGIATIRLDHTGKDETKGMRGGSAKYGDVDAVWSMKRVTDTTYQLDCTANRLPIAEKLVVIHRNENPLRHDVDGKGIFGALDAMTDERIGILDTAFGRVPLPNANASINELHRTLTLAGEGRGVARGARMSALLAERDRRYGFLATVLND